MILLLMQTLGLSESTPATDNRLKSLFWPSVKTATDVDYLGTQGYWLCTLVAVVTFVFALIGNQLLFGLLYLMFYYFGGVGVRERSRYAASVVLVMYAAETVLLWKTMLPGTIVFHVILSALLLSNLRATWIASNWSPASEEAAAPPRLSGTWGDKIADQLPMWLWPRMKLLYYIYSGGFVAMMLTIWGMYYTR